MCYVRATNNAPPTLPPAPAAASTAAQPADVSALLDAAVAHVAAAQTKTQARDADGAMSASLMDQLFLDSFTFDDNSWLNAAAGSSGDYSLFGNDASLLDQSQDAFLPWLQSTQIQPPAQQNQTEQQQQQQQISQAAQLIQQQAAILNSIKSEPLQKYIPMPTPQSSAATPAFPIQFQNLSQSHMSASVASITPPLSEKLHVHSDETTDTASSASGSPPFQIVGGRLFSTQPISAASFVSSKKRTIDAVEKPNVGRKSKKSVKVDSLETKCTALERENENLQVKLAVLENGSRFFAQREQELLDRVRNLEAQLSESHRAMLRQMSS
ncbi:hypothetical protein BDR26DRAFT_928144 [Obelidium mucronatum]|nr:hypothetical protein BDR26DRAFT_928144 [Obelidium mucronatum]